MSNQSMSANSVSANNQNQKDLTMSAMSKFTSPSQIIANNISVFANAYQGIDLSAFASLCQSKTNPFNHIAALGKAKAWELAGGLDMPFAQGTSFVTPDSDPFYGKRNLKSVIPGLAMLDVFGVNKTDAVIKHMSNSYGAKNMAAIAKLSIEKRCAVIASYLVRVNAASKLLVPSSIATNFEVAYEKALAADGIEAPEKAPYIVVESAWNFPRYNASYATVVELVNFVSSLYTEMGLPADLHPISGVEKEGVFTLNVLGTTICISQNEVYFMTYCRQYVQEVLVALNKSNVSLKDVYKMNAFDVLTFLLVEFALVISNRPDGFGRSGWLDRNTVEMTINNCSAGMARMLANVPTLDLEGTVDVDPQAAEFFMTSVTPCGRTFNSEFVSGFARGNAGTQEKNLIGQCALIDGGPSTLDIQAIIGVCQELNLKVVVSGNARKLNSIKHFAFVPSSVPNATARKVIFMAVSKMIASDKEAEVLAAISKELKLDASEAGSDSWWQKVIDNSIMPYSTKEAKIDKRVKAAHVATNINSSPAAMQWFGAKSEFVDYAGETIIAPNFNLAAPGIGYVNIKSRKKLGAFYNQYTTPAEVMGTIASIEMLVGSNWVSSYDEATKYDTLSGEEVSVKKGSPVAKITLTDGTVLDIASEADGNLTSFSTKNNINKYGKLYFEVGMGYKNYAYTVKLRNGVKANMVFSNNDLFSLNKQERSWDMLIPADAYKAGDILWYQMPELAASFVLFGEEEVVKGYKVRALIREANVAAAELLGEDVQQYDVSDRLWYSPTADFARIYDKLREAFVAIFGQTLWLNYDNATDLYTFCTRFYGSAVKSNKTPWRALSSEEVAAVAIGTNLDANQQYALACCDTEIIGEKTNILLCWQDSAGNYNVAYRGFVYASNTVEGVYRQMLHPVKVEYTTIPQSVSVSKALFGVLADVGTKSYELATRMYTGGRSSHVKFVLVENLLRGISFSSSISVINIDLNQGLEQLLEPACLTAVREAFNNDSRARVLALVAEATKGKALRCSSNVESLLYFPLIASVGFDSVGKSSMQTSAGRTYELLAHLLAGKTFGSPEVQSKVSDIFKMQASITGM